jgi:hypothetical protein
MPLDITCMQFLYLQSVLSGPCYGAVRDIQCSVINHCDRRITHIGDLDILYLYALHLITITFSITPTLSTVQSETKHDKSL